MKSPISLILAVICSPLCAFANAEDPDTLAAQQLEEVVVQGDSQRASVTKPPMCQKTMPKKRHTMPWTCCAAWLSRS